MMAILGFLCVLAFALFVCYVGAVQFIFVKGFTGTTNWPSILVFVCGLALIGLVCYYAPFTVAFKAAA